jgi:hypothetical protein
VLPERLRSGVCGRLIRVPSAVIEAASQVARLTGDRDPKLDSANGGPRIEQLPPSRFHNHIVVNLECRMYDLSGLSYPAGLRQRPAPAHFAAAGLALSSTSITSNPLSPRFSGR